MTRIQLKAVLMRAGTSKGLFLRQDDLPADRSAWNNVLLTAMGSPDPYGRQLNGVGGGSSTTSKIAIVGLSSADGVDLDYTFVAAPIGGRSLDFTGNCGNMASGVVPFAIEEGLLIPKITSGPYSATFRNTNTGVVMRATITLQDGLPVEEGDCQIDGVAETGGPIRLDFLNPAGAMTGKLLPTGQAIDKLSLPDGLFTRSTIQASLVDAANPFVFVRASDLGLTGAETPAALSQHTALLMAIRCAGSVKMGLAKTIEAAALTAGTPKIAIVGRPMATALAAGRQLSESDMDIQIRSFSMGAPHPSLQMTGAVCVAAACAVPGSIPNLLLGTQEGSAAASVGRLPSPLRIAHASGIISTDAELTYDPDTHSVTVHSASVYRTARRLFEGNVLCLVGNSQANSWQNSQKAIKKAESTPINLVLADKIAANRWLDAHAPRQDAQTV